MYNLYFLNANNYYTRKINTVSTSSSKLMLENINFNYSDGINATQIVNTKIKFNYMIAEDINAGLEDRKLSRWFIIENKKTREGQYQLTLRRDLLSDYTNEILNATSFVDKGYFASTDPAFFNKEDISVNKIQKNITYLKDGIACPWIVAYVANHKTDSSWEDTAITFETGESVIPYGSAFTSTLSFYSYLGLQNDVIHHLETVSTYMGYQYTGEDTTYANGIIKTDYEYFNDSEMSTTVKKANTVYDTTYYYVNTRTLQEFEKLIPAEKDVTPAVMGDYIYKNWLSGKPNFSRLQEYQGKIVSISGSYYKVSYKDNYTPHTEVQEKVSSADLWSAWATHNSNVSNLFTNTSTLKNITIEWTYYNSTVTLTEVQSSVESSYSISKLRKHTGSYSILATPLPVDMEIMYKTSSTATSAYYYENLNAILNLYRSMSSTWGTSAVYDVQIIPYAPLYLKEDGTEGEFYLTNLTKDKDYSLVSLTPSTDPLNVFPIIYLSNESYEFNINYKLSAEMTKKNFIGQNYRLVAPNYSSVYDIPLFENGGSIDNWHVDITLLPYQSWLRIRPEFKYYNGINFDDSRGLVISGSMQLTQLTDAWAEYQYSNMNYEAIQNTSIQYQKDVNNITNQKNIISGSINAISAGISGATGGALIGGPIGGIIGGVIGAGASTGGLIADQYYDRKLQNMALDYSQDMYNLNLGNIKGQTATISKLTALNNNFKWWPYIEFSECTDIEYEAIENKFKYNGMTVNRIGQLKDFENPNGEYYLKGKLIRFEDDIDGMDYNMMNMIADEVNKGFFIGG